jgi:hypothetical protein
MAPERDTGVLGQIREWFAVRFCIRISGALNDIGVKLGDGVAAVGWPDAAQGLSVQAAPECAVRECSKPLGKNMARQPWPS